MTYATDRFFAWQDNVRAIALGLEALREVDRYGIAKKGEQYAGWKALPSGAGSAASHVTSDEAWAIGFIRRGSGRGAATSGRRAGSTAQGACISHPDRHGGDRTLWDEVEQAAQVLGLL